MNPRLRRTAIALPKYRDYVLSLGPVGYWRLGEASGTVAKDETGHNDGAYVGSPTLATAGLLSGAPAPSVTVTTAQGMTVTSTDLDDGAAFSYLMWLYVTTIGGTKWLTYHGSGGAMIYTTSTGQIVGAKDGGTAFVVSVGAILTTSTTHFLVVTKNGAGDTGRVFLDGKDWTSLASSGQDPVPTGAALVLNRAGGTLGIAGSYSDLAVVPRALTAAEIAKMYQLGRGF